MSAPRPAASSPSSPSRPTPARLHQVIGERPGPVVGFLAHLVMDAVCALPRSARDRLARFVGWLAYTLGIRRRVALENLAHAFPEKGEAERRAIARGAYVTMARIILESLPRGERLPPGSDAEEVRGQEAWKALKASVDAGQGVLLVTAHFGNWELAGEMLLRRGVPLNALVRPLKGALNARLVDNRLRVGAGLIYPRGAIHKVLEALRLGESVVMLLDQAMPAHQALFVPFFGRLASTTPALAVAAQRSGAPVFVVMGVREGDRLVLALEGPFPFPHDEDPQTAILTHTAQVTAALERHIRRAPEQWLWLHRRWKVQPPAGS